jgi:uncharacterized protein YlbG (UPF0298 family)
MYKRVLNQRYFQEINVLDGVSLDRNQCAHLVAKSNSRKSVFEIIYTSGNLEYINRYVPEENVNTRLPKLQQHT